MHQNRTDCKGQASHDACPLAKVRDVFHFSGARFPAAFYASGGCLPFHSERKIHRRVSRFQPFARRENRDTSSKPPCCIRHRRRFGILFVAVDKKYAAGGNKRKSYWEQWAAGGKSLVRVPSHIIGAIWPFRHMATDISAGRHFVLQNCTHFSLLGGPPLPRLRKMQKKVAFLWAVCYNSLLWS